MARPQAVQTIDETGLELGEPVTRNFKLHGLANVAARVVELEADNCLRHDHAVLAYFRVEQR